MTCLIEVTTRIFRIREKIIIVEFCRYKGYHEYAKSKGIDVGAPVGLDVIVDGTVPTGMMASLCLSLFGK